MCTTQSSLVISALLENDLHIVPRFAPPDWRTGERALLHYVRTSGTPELGLYRALNTNLFAGGVTNARVLTPTTLALSSLFQPTFYFAFRRGRSEDEPPLPHASWQIATSPSVVVPSVRHWLQTLLFLSGVTLSAAIIQRRYSAGTLTSKLTRLWQAAHIARQLPDRPFESGELTREVLNLNTSSAPDLEKLITLKRLFGRCLTGVVGDLPATMHPMQAQPLGGEQAKRFGFVPSLRDRLGENLVAAFVYGSSVNSDQFNDYDLMLVVRESTPALMALAGTSPTYAGKELNIGVYDLREFQAYQLASGDNLTTHALCLHGGAPVPVKSAGDLVARNFSFGYFRLRQLIGMAAFAAEQPIATPADDKHNLFQYFVKIPLNVVRGIQGSIGLPGTKEAVTVWCRDEIGFDVATEAAACRGAAPSAGIAAAAWATEAVLTKFNERLQAFSLNSSAHPAHEQARY